jgi:hypothetical protein
MGDRGKKKQGKRRYLRIKCIEAETNDQGKSLLKMNQSNEDVTHRVNSFACSFLWWHKFCTKKYVSFCSHFHYNVM